MPDIVTGAVAAWFANKIFGPSADALGKTLAAHLQSRIPTIFGRAAEKADQLGIQPKPIAAGLLTRMIMDASFSDDDETITNWWAGLFLSASQHGDNKYAVFSDMMAVIGPREAECLRSFMEKSEGLLDEFPETIREQVLQYNPVLQERIVTMIVGETPIAADRAENVRTQLSEPALPAAVRTAAWCLPFVDEFGQTTWEHSVQPWFVSERLPIEILERTRIFRFVRVDVPVIGDATWVDLVEVTRLGAEFYAACTNPSRSD